MYNCIGVDAQKWLYRNAPDLFPDPNITGSNPSTSGVSDLYNQSIDFPTPFIAIPSIDSSLRYNDKDAESFISGQRAGTNIEHPWDQQEEDRRIKQWKGDIKQKRYKSNCRHSLLNNQPHKPATTAKRQSKKQPIQDSNSMETTETIPTTISFSPIFPTADEEVHTGQGVPIKVEKSNLEKRQPTPTDPPWSPKFWKIECIKIAKGIRNTFTGCLDELIHWNDIPQSLLDKRRPTFERKFEYIFCREERPIYFAMFTIGLVIVILAVLLINSITHSN